MRNIPCRREFDVAFSVPFRHHCVQTSRPDGFEVVHPQRRRKPACTACTACYACMHSMQCTLESPGFQVFVERSLCHRGFADFAITGLVPQFIDPTAKPIFGGGLDASVVGYSRLLVIVLSATEIDRRWRWRRHCWRLCNRVPLHRSFGDEFSRMSLSNGRLPFHTHAGAPITMGSSASRSL